MSERRQGLATATVGAAGVGGAAALRHEALVRSYEERSSKPIPRKGFMGTGAMSELRMLKHPKGRKVWLAGAGLGAVALPALATGTHKVIYGKRDKDSFWREGVAGAKEAVVDRTHTATQKTPPKLVAGNYAAGAVIGAAGGGLTHLALRKVKMPQHAKSATAAVTAGVLGTAALPLQSKITSRATHGKYEVTPTGVRRAKRKPARPSSAASVYDARTMPPAAFRDQTVAKGRKWPGPKPWKPIQTGLFEGTPDEDLVRIRAAAAKSAKKRASAAEMRRKAMEEAAKDVEKMSPRTALKAVPRTYNDVGARVGAHWTVQGLRAADAIDVPDRRVLPRTKKGKLVYTGRTKVANAVRQAAFDVGSVNDKDAMMRNTAAGHPLFGKREDFGAGMSRGERRARVTASGIPLPIVGDVMQARTAAHYAPHGRRAKSAATNFAGGQSGQIAGMAVGTGAALGAARLSPSFDRKAKNLSDGIDDVTNRARSAARLKPAGPGLISRGIAHERTPHQVKTAAAAIARSPIGRAIKHNPKTAAVGALVGGQVGGMIGQQAAYGHAMTRDDAVRARRSKARASYALAKSAGAAAPLSERERNSLARRKRHSAALSMIGGSTGIGALTATGATAVLSRRPKLAARIPKTAEALRDVQTPLLTIGAGVGGINAFTGAKVQRKEAAQLHKALRVPGVRLRAPAMRRGYLRQVRVPSTGAIRVSTVRGGLG